MHRLLSILQAGKFGGLTSSFSLLYLVIFFPAGLALFTLTPKKWKRYALLAVSLLFFWLISGVLIAYLLTAAVTVWALGLWIGKLYETRSARVKAAEKSQRKAIKKEYQQKACRLLWLGAAVCIGMLLVLKYTGFFAENVNLLLGTALPVPRFAMPIGISFFSLQAFSYLFDVYRETVKPDRNFLRVLLFLAFFPGIVEGPICRYSQTAQQLWDVQPMTYDNFNLGMQRFLYGMMKKIVVADRLNDFVASVFDGDLTLSGGILALGAVCYTVQLYMDFSGAMDASVGTAQMFGITLPENFRQPFFSRTVSEFWTRWHISLGGWFRDYIFYPVTMSAPMKALTTAARKKLGNHFGPLTASSIALFCVWLSNGLWHGAAWSFIFFGMYHFAIILTGNVIAPWVKAAQKKLHIDPEHTAYRLMQNLRTCLLVVIGELYFRAATLSGGMKMMGRILSDFRFAGLSVSALAGMGIDIQDFVIVAVTLVIVFAVSLLNERGVSVRQRLQEQKTPVRWAVLYCLILYIVIFGAYGVGYVPVDPMYANF